MSDFQAVEWFETITMRKSMADVVYDASARKRSGMTIPAGLFEAMERTRKSIESAIGIPANLLGHK